MKFHAILLLAALGAAHAVSAESVSAHRYIDAQGVEVIQNRPAAPAAGAGKQLPGAPESTNSVKTERFASGKLAVPVPSVHSASFQVSTAEQAARDQDRVGILQHELETETSRLSAAMAGIPQGAPDLALVKERMNDHRKNIASLQAELRRARGQR